MKQSGLDLQKEVEASIILMGSFQYSDIANDIDLIIVYNNYDFEALKKLKQMIANMLSNEFYLPIHFTTLSNKEYIETKKLHKEKHTFIFVNDSFNDIDICE